MKKILCIAAFAGMFSFGYCQDVDVKVNINNQEATTKEECPYKINGICSSEDIGGVDVEIVFAEEKTWAVFTNYNSFPVTVLYQISNRGEAVYYRWESCRECTREFFTTNNTTGSIVLGIEGSKKIKLDEATGTTTDGRHYYADNSHVYSIKGIIVRKMSK